MFNEKNESFDLFSSLFLLKIEYLSIFVNYIYIMNKLLIRFCYSKVTKYKFSRDFINNTKT
jgi:hypothetical protein